MAMEKKNSALLVLFICIFGLISCGYCAIGVVPAYKGFPVYPPEEIEKIERGQLTEFSLSLRARENTLKEFEQVNKDLKQQAAGPGNLNTIEMPEQKKDATMDKFDAGLSGLKKGSELIEKEFEEAQRYVIENAAKLGWKIIEKDILSDGGSHYYVFVKAQSNQQEKVMVTIFSGMIGYGIDGISVSPSDYWGKISYEFK